MCYEGDDVIRWYVFLLGHPLDLAVLPATDGLRSMSAGRCPNQWNVSTRISGAKEHETAPRLRPREIGCVVRRGRRRTHHERCRIGTPSSGKNRSMSKAGFPPLAGDEPYAVISPGHVKPRKPWSSGSASVAKRGSPVD